MSLINSGIMLRNWKNNNWMILTEVLQTKVSLKNRKRTCGVKYCWKHWRTRGYQRLLRLMRTSVCWLKVWFITRISTRIHSMVNCNLSYLRCSGNSLLKRFMEMFFEDILELKEHWMQCVGTIGDMAWERMLKKSSEVAQSATQED